jgi:IS605 OrfB family transposase
MYISIPATIHDGDFEVLKQLMRDWSSCKRYAYQRIHKDKLAGNNVKKACKPIYMSKLNARYIADAVLEAQKINQDHAIFGSKKLWNKLISKLITKKEWQEVRDSELYSRGERSKKGNANIRVFNTPEGYKLRIGLSKAYAFTTFTLYIPEGHKKNQKNYKSMFDLYSDCYDIRIKYKSGKFYAQIGLDVPEVKPIYLCKNGVVGVDTNPDGFAIIETNFDGNLLHHEYLKNDRLQYASHNKRKSDIEALAILVVNKAILSNKGIALEDLKFSEGKNRYKKFNRMKHNFIYRQLLLAVERRAIKDGVEVRKVNPAFTSIAGILKYQEQYSLNRHTAAAFIIGRRGLGIVEKIRVRLEPLKNKKLNLAGRGFKIALTVKAYSYFKKLYNILEVKTPGLTAPCLTPLSGNTA